MAELINLRQARKRAERQKKDERAQSNRSTHGQPKAQRSLARAEREKAERALDAHRLRSEGE